jgi:dynein heavy chain 1
VCLCLSPQVSYSEIVNKVEPLRHEVEKLEGDIVDLRHKHERLQATIQDLERQISVFKDEYAALIQQTQSIKLEMEQVKNKVDRSTALLASLLSERQRWEESSLLFQDQMGTVVGDALLASAFLTYTGMFGQLQRETLFSDWVLLVDVLKIQVAIDSLPLLTEYLSKATERLQWQEQELPSDAIYVQNAIVLERANRYPLIVDPSGQAANFIMKRHQSKIGRVSFLDPAFYKQLSSSLRFGTPILVDDAESLDPVLNPVLNKEVHRAGGRLLIRLGAEEIDFSPLFTMFLCTRDSDCRLSPDLLSRVTLLNFSITPASLQTQSLARILESERPDIEKKRTDLVKLQGEYAAKLRELEESLLSELNKVEGDILDNNVVLKALEDIKAEAAQITKEQDQSETVMADVVGVTQQWLPLATAATEIWFALEGLSKLNPFYQFSLAYFMEILDHVLGRDKSETPPPGAASRSRSHAHAHAHSHGTERMHTLRDALFCEMMRRTQCSLLHEDKLLLGVRLAQIRVEGTANKPHEEDLSFVVQGGQLGDGGTMSDEPTEDAGTGTGAAARPGGGGGTMHSFQKLLSSIASDEARAVWEALPHKQKAEMDTLLSRRVWHGRLEEHIVANTEDWVRLLRTSGADSDTIPTGLTHPHTLTPAHPRPHPRPHPHPHPQPSLLTPSTLNPSHPHTLHSLKDGSGTKRRPRRMPFSSASSS